MFVVLFTDLRVGNDCSAGGDHTQRGCLLHRLGHAVTVNKEIGCRCHNLFLYFCLKVSYCPETGGLRVRALFKREMPDECCAF